MLNDRIKFLKMFDEYVRANVQDENYFSYWLEAGVPDGADIFDLTEIAEDDELWLDVINTFAYVIKYGETAKQAVSFLCKIFSKKVLTNFPKCVIMVGLLTCAFTRQQAEFPLYHTPSNLSSEIQKKVAQTWIPHFV